MTDTTLTMPQIDDQDTVEAMDEVLAHFEGRVEVRGHIDDKPGIAFRVGGYRRPGLEPLTRPVDPDRPDEAFHRDRYSSMSFIFERLDEAREFEARFC